MSDHEYWLGRALELVMRERAYHRGEFVDPCEVAFRDWEAALKPGYRFDYEEGQVWVTVEVERVDRGELVRLALRVVDDTHSPDPREDAPRLGRRFRASYRAGGTPADTYLWHQHAEGRFGRLAEWKAGLS